MPIDKNKQQELRDKIDYNYHHDTYFIEHDYIVGDLVSYCNRPAIVTHTDGFIATLLYLDDYTTVSTHIKEIHYLCAGQHYLKQAHTWAKVSMLVEKLSAAKEDKEEHDEQ